MKDEGAVIGRGGSVVDARANFRGLDGGVRNDAARRVGHRSIDGAAERLAVGRYCK